MAEERERESRLAVDRPQPSLREVIVVLTLLALLQFLFAHSFNTSLRMVPGGGQSIDIGYEAISEGSIARRVGIVALGLVGGLLLYRSRDRVVSALTVPGILGTLFVVWASLSLVWAVEPALVSRRLISFWLLLIAAVGVVRWAPPNSIPWFLALSSCLCVAVGVGAEVALGTFRPFFPDYRFSGTLHPNSQGANCALLVLAGVWIGTGRVRRNRAIGLAVALVGLLFLLLTKSRVSFASTVGAGLLLVVMRFPPRRRWILVTAGINLVILLGMLIVNGIIDAPLEVLMLGRSYEDVTSMNSRLPLWEILFPYIADRPITGFGYSGFMTVEHAKEIALIFEFGIAGAHSIYLETLLGLGVVGVILLTLTLVAAFARGVAESLGSGRAATSLLAAVVAYEIVSGVLEHTLVFPTWRFPSLLAITALCLTAPRSRDFGRRAFHSSRRAPVGSSGVTTRPGSPSARFGRIDLVSLLGP